MAAQSWYANCSKIQEVTPGAVTSAGTQQGTVPKWHQAGASTSSQLSEAPQVGGFFSSELRLHAIVGYCLLAQNSKAPA